MLDENGNTAPIGAELTYAASSTVANKPDIYEAKIIGKDAIRIKSSKELQTTGQVIAAADGTTTTKPATSIVVIDFDYTGVNFNNFDSTKSYTLKYVTLSDISGQYTRTTADSSNKIKVVMGK